MTRRNPWSYSPSRRQRPSALNLFLKTLLYVGLGTGCFLLGFFVLSRYIPTGKGPETPTPPPSSAVPLPPTPSTQASLPTTSPTPPPPSSPPAAPVQSPSALPGEQPSSPAPSPTNNDNEVGSANGPLVLPANSSTPQPTPGSKSAQNSSPPSATPSPNGPIPQQPSPVNGATPATPSFNQEGANNVQQPSGGGSGLNGEEGLSSGGSKGVGR